MTLPYDVARCHGFECVCRNTCKRYLAVEDHKPHTPFYFRMCIEDEDRIEVDDAE